MRCPLLNVLYSDAHSCIANTSLQAVQPFFLVLPEVLRPHFKPHFALGIMRFGHMRMLMMVIYFVWVHFFGCSWVHHQRTCMHAHGVQSCPHAIQ